MEGGTEIAGLHRDEEGILVGGTNPIGSSPGSAGEAVKLLEFREYISRSCFRFAEAHCLASLVPLHLLLHFTGCDQAPLRGQQP